jgi:hypothetical protein
MSASEMKMTWRQTKQHLAKNILEEIEVGICVCYWTILSEVIIRKSLLIGSLGTTVWVKENFVSLIGQWARSLAENSWLCRKDMMEMHASHSERQSGHNCMDMYDRLNVRIVMA